MALDGQYPRHLFDTIGRRKMIAGTYILSGLLLKGTGVLFKNGALTATTIPLAWSPGFFFASTGASKALELVAAPLSAAGDTPDRSVPPPAVAAW